MTVQRHAGHDPAQPCRPAGSGLCEPAPAGLAAWRAAWIPSESEKRAATALMATLLAVPEAEQLNTLALLCNLWCYHREAEAGRRPA